MTPEFWIGLGTVVLSTLFTLLAGALVAGGLRQQIVEHEKRLAKCEADMVDVAKALSGLELSLARIPEQLNSQDKVMELRFKAVDHSIAGLKQIIENAWLARPRAAQRGPAAAS